MLLKLCGHDRMTVEFTTTYAISANHHRCCEFESRSGRGVQHSVIKFVSDLRQVDGFLRGPPVSSTNETDRHDITEILLKVALNTIKQTNKYTYIMIYFYMKANCCTCISQWTYSNDSFVIWPIPLVLSHFVNSQIRDDKVKKNAFHLVNLSNSCISKHTKLLSRR
jgi:hypothetical protein